MALHVQVTRRRDLLIVKGVWDTPTRLPLFDTFTVPVTPGETAAESVELFMMDLNMAPSWLWSTRTDSPVLEGEFVVSKNGMPSYKEVADSLARFNDLEK